MTKTATKTRPKSAKDALPKTALDKINSARPEPKTVNTPAIIKPTAKEVAGVVGELNQMRSTGVAAYQAEPLIPSGSGKHAVRSRMDLITPQELETKMGMLFPEVDPGETACDCLVIVQELLVPRTMAGGRFLRADETRDADQATTSYGKVVSIGPMCFKQDVTGEDFPGGASFKIGDIVRTPKYSGGGQEFLIDDVIFNYWKDRDIKGVITDHRKIISIYF